MTTLTGQELEEKAVPAFWGDRTAVRFALLATAVIWLLALVNVFLTLDSN